LAEFKNITKKYENNTVLDKFSLKIVKGSKIAIMGESGCGKTTLLRIAAGLSKPDGGEFVSDEKKALMFQEPRLLPWKNALDNVKSVLPKEQYPLADKYLSAVGLSDTADKYPRELSGGMAQRVAFARFLAFSEADGATLLLLDEPLSALDDETTDKMIDLLKDFSKHKTVIIVTHDKNDAEKFADHVVKM
jgi:ABC-type nitrate/sulfonate/bicarbonate transport system ATPase subunit